MSAEDLKKKPKKERKQEGENLEFNNLLKIMEQTRENSYDNNQELEQTKENLQKMIMLGVLNKDILRGNIFNSNNFLSIDNSPEIIDALLNPSLDPSSLISGNDQENKEKQQFQDNFFAFALFVILNDIKLSNNGNIQQECTKAYNDLKELVYNNNFFVKENHRFKINQDYLTSNQDNIVIKKLALINALILRNSLDNQSLIFSGELAKKSSPVEPPKQPEKISKNCHNNPNGHR